MSPVRDLTLTSAFAQPTHASHDAWSTRRVFRSMAGRSDEAGHGTWGPSEEVYFLFRIFCFFWNNFCFLSLLLVNPKP